MDLIRVKTRDGRIITRKAKREDFIRHPDGVRAHRYHVGKIIYYPREQDINGYIYYANSNIKKQGG